MNANKIMSKLKIRKSEINAKDEHGRTPLGIACEKGCTNTVKQLLENQVIKVNLLSQGKSPLVIACLNGYLDIVNQLLENESVSINLEDKFGQRPLTVACDNGHADIVEILLKKNDIDFSYLSKNQISRMVELCEMHTGVLLRLVNNKEFKTNAKDKHGRTPLGIACETGCTKTVKLLLERKRTKVNLLSQGKPPLIIACLNGHLDIVNQLLENENIDINVRDELERKPLIVACFSGHANIVESLLKRKNTNLSIDETSLIIKHCDLSLDILQNLLDLKNSFAINTEDKYGRTPLGMACEEGLEDIVKRLLENKDIDVNHLSNGNPPLFIAYNCKHFNIVYQLLSKTNAIDVNKPDSSNNPLLLYACKDKNFTVIKYLLTNHNVTVNLLYEDDNTPLHYIIWRNKRTKILDTLFQGSSYKIHSYSKPPSDQPRTHPVCKILIEDSSLINFQDDEGNTPLHLAAEYENEDLIKFLMSYEADNNITNDSCKTPAQIAHSINPKLVVLFDLVTLQKLRQIEILFKQLRIRCLIDLWLNKSSLRRSKFRKWKAKRSKKLTK